MKTIFSIFGLFILIVLFLSIEVGNKPIFSYVYKFISPATQSAQHATESFFSKSVNGTQSYSKKIFSNSEPRMKDAVKSKQSAIKKSVSEPAENITEKEKKELDQLIKNH